MALALDASTPAAVHGASGAASVTTASFTPPAGSVILVCAGVNAGSAIAENISTPTDNLGSHLTYTAVLSEGDTTNGSDAIAKLWWASVSASAAQTITISHSGAAGSNLYLYLRVLVFTGAKTSGPVGASGGGNKATGVISDTYTSTDANSWGWLLISDWSAQTTTVGAAETIQDSYVVGGQISYALIEQNALTSASGASVTMSTTAPTSAAQQAHIYFEVLPVPLVGPTIGSVPSGTAMTAGSLSAKFLFFDTGDYSPGL
jgi:hypothetical protein